MASEESRLSRIRKAQGVRREKIAADAGISVQYLWALERGKHQPSLDVARRLAAALNTTVDQLFPERAA
jgi:putative transcriptional regulator